MSWGIVASVGGAIIGGVIASDGAQSAAETQAGASQAGIAENRYQFDKVQELLRPYVQAGGAGLQAYRDLIGIGGTQGPTIGGGTGTAFGGAFGTVPFNGGGVSASTAQQTAINGIKAGPEFTTLTKQGEDAILANASATGGLRGGNVQGGLANFRSNLLSSLIDKQLTRYAALAQQGQNSAAGVGSAALTTGQQVAGLLQQQGAAVAGGQLAGSNALAGAVGNIGGILATRMGGTPVQTNTVGGGGFGTGVVYGNQDYGQYF